MSTFILAVLFGSLWAFILLYRWLTSASPSGKRYDRKLPPGPRGLPIIGNLHMLSNLPHRTLHALAKKYGPIMFLRLGYVPTIVVSSPKAAEFFLKTYEATIANRPVIQASQFMTYGSKGMVFTPYGPYWRNVKKFCTLELLTATKIDTFAGMRREEVGLLVESLKEAAAAREVVDVSEKVGELIKDMTCRMLFGRSKDDRFDLKAVTQEAMELAGAFNIADYVPFLAPFDLQGLTRRLKAQSKAFDKMMEIIINEHEQDANKDIQKPDRDFVDVMLSIKNKSRNTLDESPYTIDRASIKAILLEIISGAIDTSHVTIEWVLSELLRNSRVTNKLQEELKSVIGVDRMVEETDLPKLKYLDMLIKETFRLHPVTPLLVPRESMEDIIINGYSIPKKSRIVVNSWALGRDPDVWSNNVEEFLPERFINSGIDFRGRDFQFLPFGSGRRGCPGMHLGLVNVRLVVAQLVHCFNWELPNGMSSSDLDMSEKFGLTMPRAKNLLVIPAFGLQIT